MIEDLRVDYGPIAIESDSMLRKERSTFLEVKSF
jgi:hypothetical protein